MIIPVPDDAGEKVNRSVAIVRETRNGVRPMLGAKN